ncbi:MAG TPA: hypothetical protein VFG52_00160, partial [Xanthomonadales bacterium]|nr:hypothetical protein [Xanthomonadales bacterium]
KGHATPYRSTHVKHPCVLWVEESYDNFLWLSELAVQLNREYRYRFEKAIDHKSMAVVAEISKYRFESVGLTGFAQAMPDEYKVPGDAVSAYRQFYLAEKMGFAKWTRRELPHWVHA